MISHMFINRKHVDAADKFLFRGFGIGKLLDETDEESRKIDKYSR